MGTRERQIYSASLLVRFYGNDEPAGPLTHDSVSGHPFFVFLLPPQQPIVLWQRLTLWGLV